MSSSNTREVDALRRALGLIDYYCDRWDVPPKVCSTAKSMFEEYRQSEDFEDGTTKLLWVACIHNGYVRAGHYIWHRIEPTATQTKVNPDRLKDVTRRLAEIRCEGIMRLQGMIRLPQWSYFRELAARRKAAEKRALKERRTSGKKSTKAEKPTRKMSRKSEPARAAETVSAKRGGVTRSGKAY